MHSYKTVHKLVIKQANESSCSKHFFDWNEQIKASIKIENKYVETKMAEIYAKDKQSQTDRRRCDI